MPTVFGANGFAVLALLVFVFVLLLLEAAFLWWRGRHGPRARQLRERLQAVRAPEDNGADTSQLLRQRVVSDNPTLEARLLRLRHVEGLARFLTQSGTGMTLTRVAVWTALAAAAGWLVASLGLHQSLLIRASFGAAFALVPVMWVARQRARRLRRIEQQLPDALDLMARALRAGHAFTAALKMAGEEFALPIAGELRAVHDEVNFGVSLPEALEHLGNRVPLTDVRYFIVAVLIQRESGGNLTEVLGSLASLVRERLKLQARVRVLSSEGRMSAWILSLLPFALGAGMWAVNPKFMAPLWNDPIGIAIMKYTLGLMALGVVIMRKIIHIRI